MRGDDPTAPSGTRPRSGGQRPGRVDASRGGQQPAWVQDVLRGPESATSQHELKY